MRGTRRKNPTHRAAFPIRTEIVRFQRYQEQFKYLYANEITTTAQLGRQIAVLEWDIGLLTGERKPFYLRRRKTEDEKIKAQYSAEIDRQTAALRQKRQELALCRRIEADIPTISETARQTEQPKELRKKEEQQHEYQRRNR